MTEVEQPAQNGEILVDEDENNKSRPADIEQDMREMERRKRVEAIMSSKLFREELERIVDSQLREGGASGILQQLSDIVGVPASRVGSVFKSSNCVLPINDIRGVESMGYAKGEKILRCKLAATFRLLDLYGWSQGLGAQITARLQADQELFLVNPFGLLFHEVTASSLNKVDMQGNIVEQGTTNFGINTNQIVLHSVVHAARPDIRCAIYIGCNPVVAVSSLKVGVLPLTKDSAVLGEIATHPYTGSLNEPEEREKLIRSLGPISKVLLLNNHGALCCGETIEEAFHAAYHIVQACETQLKLLPVGLDNLVLIPEETRKAIYDASRKPPEGFEHKSSTLDTSQQQPDNKEDGKDVKDGGGGKEKLLHQKPKWRVGGAEFEALMRMLDNAGFRTGYIYRHPLVKSELPKPKNDVEVPPAVSSLGYLLEEEELYRQGIWKKSDLRKGGDRTRWLNSPNVYQKVEVLETGTPDPKKITKWVADGSPTHSTPVKIEHALQFVPKGTNPKEFKSLQQLIKDNRRADKISAGPQSHILEGVTWDEANRIRDATVSATGDHVVLVGAASKGIIQRGYQHNATVYKAPYAKNPFDSVTDDELNEYKRTIERKHTQGEYTTDTDFSESEALSSLQTSGAQQKSSAKHVQSQSETEDASEPQVLRIETKHAPKPSQPEVVLSDANTDFLEMERAHVTISKKPPTGREVNNKFNVNNKSIEDFNTINNNPLTIINSRNNLNDNQTNINNNLIHLNDKKINEKSSSNLILKLHQSEDDNEYYKREQNEINSSLLPLKFHQERCYLKELSKVISIRNQIKNTNETDDNDAKTITGDSDDSSTSSIATTTDSSNTTNSYVSLDILEKFKNPYMSPSENEFCTIKTTIDLKNSIDNLDMMNSPNFYQNLSETVVSSSDDCYINRRPYSIITNSLYLYDEPYNILNTITHKNFLYYQHQTSSKNSSSVVRPYRTVSHFGFNYPTITYPDHKHFPISPTKYKPMKRDNSYEEIFGNPINIDDDDCFYEILKRKACETLSRHKTILTTDGNWKRIFSPRKNKFSVRKRKFEEDGDDNDGRFMGDSDEQTNVESSDICNAVTPKQLDPILEEDENVQDVQNDHSSILVKSDFIEKIAKLNYSDESPNVNFEPNDKLGTVDSDITFSCVASVIDYVLKEDEMKDEREESNNEDIQENVILKSTSTEIHVNTSSIEKKRKLMGREERIQRKEEFYELWEDHITYYSNSFDSESDEFWTMDDDNTLNEENSEEEEVEENEIRIEKSNIEYEDKKIPNDFFIDEEHSDNHSYDNKMIPNNTFAVIQNEEDENGCFVQKLYILSDEMEVMPLNNETTDAKEDDELSTSRNNDNNIPEQFNANNAQESDNQHAPSNIDCQVDLASTSNKNLTVEITQQSNDEAQLNSIEKLILEKIENSELDRTEGTIFNKIERTIRHKVTPMKLEKLINEECCKNEMRASTPTLTTTTTNTSISSLYSLNLSDVKSGDNAKAQKMNNSQIKPTSNDNKDSKEKIQKSTLKHTKNNDQEKPKKSSIGQKDNSRRSKSPKLKNFDVKVNIKHSISTPPIAKNSKSKSPSPPFSKKRNFINENIKNASRYLRGHQHSRHNFGAIFAINPFDNSNGSGNNSTNNKSKSNLKVKITETIKKPKEEKKNNNKSSLNTAATTTSIYSFRTDGKHGSPRLWVTISPQKDTKNVSNRKNCALSINNNKKNCCCKNPTSTVKNNQKINNIVTKSKKQDDRSNGDKTTGSGGNGEGELNRVENEIKKLSKATNTLNTIMNRYEKKADCYNKQISQIHNDFNEIVELHENIETNRRELRQNLFGDGGTNCIDGVQQQLQPSEILTVSISEDDD